MVSLLVLLEKPLFEFTAEFAEYAEKNILCDKTLRSLRSPWLFFHNTLQGNYPLCFMELIAPFRSVLSILADRDYSIPSVAGFNQTVKILPSPGVLSTVMSPSIRVTISLDIARPNPVPAEPRRRLAEPR
jgi:hypothetical protein